MRGDVYVTERPIKKVKAKPEGKRNGAGNSQRVTSMTAVRYDTNRRGTKDPAGRGRHDLSKAKTMFLTPNDIN